MVLPLLGGQLPQLLLLTLGLDCSMPEQRRASMSAACRKEDAEKQAATLVHVVVW